MNQALYFGQLVIGPAGSGKVLFVLKFQNVLKLILLSPHIVKLYKTWGNYYVGIFWW